MPVSSFLVFALTITVVVLWFGRTYVHFRGEVQGHGGAGGYDQGLAIAKTYLDEDFLAISPSRDN